MIAIKTDGNTTIGSGHIMRCISIANEIRADNMDVLFICTDDCSAQIIRSFGFAAEITNGIYNHPDAETEKLLYILKEHHISKILVDSYYVTPGYLSEIRKQAKLFYIDDLAAFHYPVDVLINYNINYDDYIYEGIYKTEKLILGPKYAPLRKEFQGISPIRIKDKVESIMITTGGTDPFNISGRVLDAAARDDAFTDVKFDVIIGKFNQSEAYLARAAEHNPNIRLHENAVISEIMLHSDIAVSAGGSTVYELCVCGLPSVLFSFADNQRKPCEAFKAKNVALYAGDYAAAQANDVNRIIDSLKELMINRATRQRLHGNALQVTDGRGAQRIAQEMLKMQP
jgi:UDP-2,4-diacetamido-2,4,6-trideoxy-beta-L-altropyranose hydrolase